MNTRLVSIIIPTYNRAHLIRETLDSVLAQTYTNWECIVVDDGSTDNTKEVIENYIQRDKRFQFYARPTNKCKGASTCRNIGFDNSKGVYVQYLDSDDLISRNKIKVQVELLDQSEENSISICKWVMFTDDIKGCNHNWNLPIFKSFSTPKDFLYELGKSNKFFPIHSYLVHRNLVYKAGKWNEYLDLNDDGEFFVRVLLNTSAIHFVSSEMAYYRRSTGSNLSIYSSFEKANRGILSWKLIEIAMYVRFGDINNLYVESAKESIYRVIYKSFPEVVVANKVFFKKQIRNNRIHKKVLVKLSLIKKYLF